MDEFDDFARAHADTLVRLSFALCGDRGAAEDAAQTALERVYLRWGKLDDPLPYARRIAVNCTRDRWRRLGRREQVGDVTEGPGTEAYGAVEDREQIVHLMRTLPHGQRSVLVLRYLLDLTEQDTAEVLGLSLGTVKSQASKGLARLRLDLSDPVTRRTP